MKNLKFVEVQVWSWEAFFSIATQTAQSKLDVTRDQMTKYLDQRYGRGNWDSSSLKSEVKRLRQNKVNFLTEKELTCS